MFIIPTFKAVIIIIFIFISITGVSRILNTKSAITVMLPDNLYDWKVSLQDLIYNSENLFDYIDGGAEVYLSYGFKKLVTRTYNASNQPNIQVDIFDMGTSQNAFGVFSHSREKEDKKFGQGSQYTSGLLLFWKNRYFISILSYPETEKSKKAVFSLARHIESSIKTEGPLPEILILLPKESLVKESIRYFHHYIWLNSYYFVSHENILHINNKTDALLAKYGKQQKRSILLIVKYMTARHARNAYSDFTKNYLPELKDNPIIQIEDSTWTGCRLVMNYLIIVFNSAYKDNALHLIKRVQKKLHSK